MKIRSLLLAAITAIATLTCLQVRADNMATLAIAPTTGAVTLVPRWTTSAGLSGFHHMAQDLSLGGGANQFYSIKGAFIPQGGDISAFTRYIPATGAATNHVDIGSKLSPNSYAGLTSADPDLGFGSVQLYFIHKKNDGDYFSHIVPSSGNASAVTDLKPMSGPGGPATGGATGYFSLTFAASNIGYGSNLFYYFRTDPVTQFTQFGSLVPALAGASADRVDLGQGGHRALTYAGDDVGYGPEQMYFLRLDPVTGYTILGTLHPVTGRAADIANLGSVFTALTFVPGDIGFGTGQFYTTGAVNPTWQSVSFAAIADRLISAGSFTVAPSASSGLPVALAVRTGSIGAASITGPVAGVYTVTPTAPGLITLQATQDGQVAPTVIEFNLLRQSFTATGLTLLDITGQPTAQTKVEGTTAQFSVTAAGTSVLSYQWRKAGANITGNASATTATLSLPNVQLASAGTYDVVVTNTAGSIPSDPATLTVTVAPPVITNSPLSAAGTVGTFFNYAVTASGNPTSYSGSPLPAGLSINSTTGNISGTPTAIGSVNVLLGANNAGGTDNATLTITIAAAGVTPIITNNPLTAAGTTGTSFSFTITASGIPTSYSAAPLPAGLLINSASGVITGTPTTAGSTSVLLGATNSTGTGNATLTITVAAAGVTPVITNNPLTAGGTTGTPFNFTITASGSPTSFSASPLPPGLLFNTVTGNLSGTPTASGVTSVLLGATNSTGTGSAALTITIAAAGVTPVITNNPLTAGGTTGTPFSFSITASGTPTSFSAAPLPAGLVFNTVTGSISGTPTTAGTTSVLLGATNSTGTGSALLTITVTAAGVTPIITNNPLTAGGTTGTPFSFSITASGTPTSFTAAPLPAGLLINSVTGNISGTPTAAGTTSVLLGATNSTGTGNATLTITVAAAGVAPIITNNPLTAGGTTGTPFSFTIIASGTPTSFSAAPLPAGLLINSVTGNISGTPTVAGTTSVLLEATNATGTDSALLTITVTAAGVTPIITNNPLTAGGTTGTPFSFTITASGTPTSFSAAPLPAGLLINSVTGSISGTPTAAGTTSVLLGATNATGTGNATLTITVAAAGVTPIITNNPLTAGGTTGTPFSFSITASGTPTSYSATPLPAGLTVNTVTGNISGTPTVAGTTSVLLEATNATGTDSALLTITVTAAGVTPIITNNPLTAGGTTGTPFSFSITASGTPTSFSAAPLPAGLLINSVTGNLSGTPTAAGTTSVLLGATNATGTGNATLTITVTAAGVAPIITNNPQTAGATVGTPFSFTITASGTPTSFSSSPLPAGLTINPVTGNISGTPTTAGVTSVLLGATNATGTGNAALTITVAAAGVAPIITNNPLTAGGTTGTPFNFTVTASGTPTSFSAAPLPAGLVINSVTGNLSGTPTTAGTTSVLLGATNATGTGNATLTITVAAAGVAPIVTNDPLTAGGTTGTPFSFTVTASGTPTSFSAAPLPVGLLINPVTGNISGIPTVAGTTSILLGATNSTGTGSALLTITVVPAGVAPIIVNSSFTARGTLRTPFSYTIAASGTPTSFSAAPLPPGLVFNSVTGVFSGIPTVAGTTEVTLAATNAVGAATATLSITIYESVHVTIRGPLGTVIYLTDGGALPPEGTTYTVKGLPKGFVLDPLTGQIATPGLVTAKPGTYRVTYATITLDANGKKIKGAPTTFLIVVDPLTAEMSGRFEALLETTPAPGVPIGKVQIAVNPQTAGFTGTVVTSAKTTVAIKGLLELDATYAIATATVAVKHGAGTVPYRLELRIDSVPATEQVFYATLLEPGVGNAPAAILGDSDTGVQLAVFTKAAPAAWLGRYSLVLNDPTTPPVNLGDTPMPEGTGYGRIHVSADKAVLDFKGRLGDGTLFTASLSPSADGSYRWFSRPYIGGGRFGGWLRFAPLADDGGAFQLVGEADSELYWVKDSTGAAGQSYRSGFGPVLIAATAQPWAAPAHGTPLSTLLGLNTSVVESSFTSDSLPENVQPLLPVALGLDDRNRFVVVSPAANSAGFSGLVKTWNGSFTTSSGSFTASFKLEDNRTVHVSGVLLQQPEVVAGTVIGEGIFALPPVTAGGEQVYGRVRFVAP